MKKFFHLIRNRDFVALNCIFFSIFIASIAIGINAINLPSVLITNGISSVLISLSATNDLIFGAIGAVLITVITKKIKVATAAIIISILHGIGIFFLFQYHNYFLWLLISGTTVACWISVYVIRQAWINHLITKENRSLLIALISTIFCVGFVIGAVIIKLLGALTIESFTTSSLLLISSGIILFLVRKTQPNGLDGEILSIKQFFAKLPKSSFARFLLDMQGGLIILLGVLFGVKIGLSLENAGFLLAAFMASGLVDIYAGILGKKFNLHKMIFSGYVACLICCIVMTIFYQNYKILLASFFFLGASFALILISSLTIVNNSFSEKNLVAANGTFQAIGSIGSIVGCILGGIAMQFFDFYGFLGVLISVNLSYILFQGFFREV